MLIGYARISKADGSQSLDLQRDARSSKSNAWQRTTRRSPKYCAGCERDLEEAAAGAGTAARAGARLWPQPLGPLYLLWSEFLPGMRGKMGRVPAVKNK